MPRLKTVLSAGACLLLTGILLQASCAYAAESPYVHSGIQTLAASSHPTNAEQLEMVYQGGEALTLSSSELFPSANQALPGDSFSATLQVRNSGNTSCTLWVKPTGALTEASSKTVALSEATSISIKDDMGASLFQGSAKEAQGQQPYQVASIEPGGCRSFSFSEVIPKTLGNNYAMSTVFNQWELIVAEAPQQAQTAETLATTGDNLMVFGLVLPLAVALCLLIISFNQQKLDQ